VTWALVPVKPFRLAKTRLSGALSPARRATLARALLMRTLDVLARVEELSGILIVSTDPFALELGQQRNVTTLRDSGDGLNGALGQARAAALARGARAALVLPADLPRLTPGDVRALLALAAGADVVVAPSLDGHGTNALYTRPPDALHYAFGPESFREHLAQAETSGLCVRVCATPGFALDLDTPEDLAAWLRITTEAQRR
jgi:2-phospho-L-lactate guanylyltransferase